MATPHVMATGSGWGEVAAAEFEALVVPHEMIQYLEQRWLKNPID